MINYWRQGLGQQLEKNDSLDSKERNISSRMVMLWFSKLTVKCLSVLYMMKKFLIPIGILCLVGSFVHFHVFAADGFSDTAGHKYADSIEFLSQVGVVE